MVRTYRIASIVLAVIALEVAAGSLGVSTGRILAIQVSGMASSVMCIGVNGIGLCLTLAAASTAAGGAHLPLWTAAVRGATR